MFWVPSNGNGCHFGRHLLTVGGKQFVKQIHGLARASGYALHMPCFAKVTLASLVPWRFAYANMFSTRRARCILRMHS